MMRISKCSRPALLFLLYGVTIAQVRAPTAEAPRFEVASVKPIVPGTQPPGWPNIKEGRERGRYTMWHVTLGILIRNAYKIEPYRLKAPPWIDDFRYAYDIVATMPPSTTDQEVMRMLQNLLADRFELKLRHETKETAVYAMEIAKHGPKLTPAANPSQTYPTPVGSWGFSLKNTSMHNLASMIMRWTDRPVIDLTGLTGVYDVDLSWKPLSPDEPPNPLAPLDALQILGLKSVARKLPIEFMIVEQADKIPVEN